MLSLWDMLVASRYPYELKYFYLGISVFVAAFLLSICILPYVIHSIWVIVKPVGKKRAVFGNKEHDYNHYRITVAIFVSVIILQVVSVIICVHAVYFLANIIAYKEFIINIKERGQDFSGYLIPSDHYILYFLEAVLEAAREALLLWGFLFLVNYICKLIVKKFYFKTFFFLLILRVGFVFVCSLRIPELIANLANNDNFKKVLLASSPFQTLAKSLRTLEISINLFLCIIFVIFLWRSIREKLNMIENRPDGQPASPFDSRINTLCDTREMRRIKKYAILYLVLLTTELILSLIQCQFPNFVVRYKDMVVEDTILLEIIFAFLTDVLSFILPILTILFIVILINSMGKYRTFQNNPPSYGSVAHNDELPHDNIPYAQSMKLTFKCILINGGIVLLIAIVITAFTSYIWFVKGNRAHVILRPGDYIRLDDKESDLYKFMNTCDTVMAERNVDREFTVFDMKEEDEEDSFTPKSCLFNQSVLFYRNPTQKTNQSKFIDNQAIISGLYWLPRGTYFNNFTTPQKLEFSVKFHPEPCYTRKLDVTGFFLTCGNMSYPQYKFSCENGSDCMLTQSGVYHISLPDDVTGQVTFSWNRPMFVGTGNPGVSYHDIEEDVRKFDVVQFENIQMRDYSDNYCSVYFVCYMAKWKAGIYCVSTFVVVVVYLSVTLLVLTFCRIKLLKC